MSFGRPIGRVVVVGAGAIGGTVGGLLAAAGHEVMLVARGAHGDALADGGLRLRRPGGEQVLRVPVARTPGEVGWRPEDLAVVAVKLQDAEAALDALVAAAGRSVGPRLAVLCAQNGVDGERLAAARFERVLGTVSWMPCAHLEPGVVEAYGDPVAGDFDVGAITPAARGLVAPAAALLRSAGFVVEEVEDVWPLKYTKLLTNLGNVAQVLIADEHERRRVGEAARAEGEEILRAAGIPYAPLSTFVKVRSERVKEAEIAGARRGGGSTWQSHARGKPLETPWLNGAIVRIAEGIGRDAPVNRGLLEDALAACGAGLAAT